MNTITSWSIPLALVLSLGANFTNASEILSGVDDVEDACDLVAKEFFAERQKDLNDCIITGQELAYIDGDDQSKVGLFLEFANPFVLEGLK